MADPTWLVEWTGQHGVVVDSAGPDSWTALDTVMEGHPPGRYVLTWAAGEGPTVSRVADLPSLRWYTAQPTHYDGCWRDPKHHGCAVARVEELEARAARLQREVAAWSAATLCLGCGLRDDAARTDEDGMCTTCGGEVLVGSSVAVEQVEEALAEGKRAREAAYARGYARGRAEEREACIAIATGCTDYLGGYGGQMLEAYHHGMDTVARALAGPDDTQRRVVEAIGRDANKSGAHRREGGT